MKPFYTTLILLLVVASASAQQPRTGAAAARADASRKIVGRILDEGGRPVAAATVLILPAGKSGNVQQTIMTYRHALSDKLGRFEFEELTPGAYHLTASTPGYVLSADSVMEGGRMKFFRPGDNLTLHLVKGGVITGMVTDANAEPVVAARVRAHKIKDEKGRPAMMSPALDENSLVREWKTDDRGIYRIYGLEPGTYLVSAGGRGLNPMTMGAFDQDAPSYHPAATRDTAVPVLVQAGQEVGSIDIRYRETKGYVISGKVINPQGKANAAMNTIVTLMNAATGGIEGLGVSGFMGGVTQSSEGSSSPFSVSSVADGDYMIMATFMGNSIEGRPADLLVSPPQLVRVKGEDVTGVELKLSPNSLIVGQFVLEKLQGASAAANPLCQPRRPTSVEEAVISARSDAKRKPGIPFINLTPFGYPADGVPDEKGAFQIRAMEAGRFRFDVKLPAEEWYIQSITQVKEAPTPPAAANAATAGQTSGQTAITVAPPPTPAARPAAAASQPRDVARLGLSVKLGEQVMGVRIVAAEGAAGVKGVIKPEGATTAAATALPPLRVFLVPAEPENADNVVRFYQTDVQKDMSFAFANLAPGRYLALVRVIGEAEANEVELRPVAWHDDERVTLRLQAMSANHAVDLVACQRVANLALKFVVPTPAKKPEVKKASQ